MISSLLAALHARSPQAKWARKSQRFAVSLPARLRVSNSAGSNWEKVVLDNLSLGGARIRALTRLTKKTKIDLAMNLDGGREFELRALVVYARRGKLGFHCEYGLRFVELTYERYKALINYVNEREAAQKEDVSQQPQHSRGA
jgi:c-di-GMP-binding flagellar brake protein YcgR